MPGPHGASHLLRRMDAARWTLQSCWSCAHPSKDPSMPRGGSQQHRLAHKGIIQQDGKWFPARSSQQRVWPARPDDTAGRRRWLLPGRTQPSSFQRCCQAFSRENEFHRLPGTLHGTTAAASHPVFHSSRKGSEQDPATALAGGAAMQEDGSEMRRTVEGTKLPH